MPRRSSLLFKRVSTWAFKRLTLIFALCLFLDVFHRSEAQEIVNVFAWIGSLPDKVIKDFEKETNIKVNLDVYSGNDVLEAQLLMGASKYDVIFPTARPIGKNHVEANLYLKLDHSKLPNLKNLDQKFIDLFLDYDPKADYVLPFSWGFVGFAYNEELIKKIDPKAPIDSWGMFFEESVVHKFKKCGVSLLEEGQDVFPYVMQYLGLNPNEFSLKNLERAYEHMQTIRPYIKQFNSYQSLAALVNGELCLVQGVNCDIARFQRVAMQKKTPMRVKFVYPKEGTFLWCDVIAIPRTSKNPDNAHKFINYLLDGKVGARITAKTLAASANKEARRYIKKEILENPIIYPTEEHLHKMMVEGIPTRQYERKSNRYWLQLRMAY